MPTLEKHFKNACAMSNAFFPPLSTENPNWRQKADLTIKLMSMCNALEARVRSESWMTMRAHWKNIDEVILPSFPRFSEEDLRNLTLGSYQLQLASEYSNQHVREKSYHEI